MRIPTNLAYALDTIIRTINLLMNRRLQGIAVQFDAEGRAMLPIRFYLD
jgi:hypothetical protein